MNPYKLGMNEKNLQNWKRREVVWVKLWTESVVCWSQDVADHYTIQKQA